MYILLGKNRGKNVCQFKNLVLYGSIYFAKNPKLSQSNKALLLILWFDTDVNRSNDEMIKCFDFYQSKFVTISIILTDVMEVLLQRGG